MVNAVVDALGRESYLPSGLCSEADLKVCLPKGKIWSWRMSQLWHIPHSHAQSPRELMS